MIYGEMNTRNCNANGGDGRRNRKKRQTERNDGSTNMGDGCVHIDEERKNTKDNQGNAPEDWTRTNNCCSNYGDCHDLGAFTCI